jgi:hypothetical protein
MSRCIIVFMDGLIASISSILMACPLVSLAYLLTADWDIPRIWATCFCFMSYFSKSSLAISALIAGTTAFTATSHGTIKRFPVSSISAGKVYKDAVCHIIYDVCHGGCINIRLLHPISSSQSVMTPVRKGKGIRKNEN